MKNLNTIIAVAALTTCAAFAGTFQTIKFTQETHSDTDPFGVQALATVSQKVETVETTVGTISTKMETVEGKVTQLETKDLTPDIANEVKKQLTNNTDVVIGQVTGTSDDIGLVAKNNSIVLAVKRDMDEIEATEGSITFAADKIQLGALDSIYVGEQSLQSFVSNNLVFVSGIGLGSAVQKFIDNPFSNSRCQAYGIQSHAEGHATVAGNVDKPGTNETAYANRGDIDSGYGAHSEGVGSMAIGKATHAEGEVTKAFVYAAHAEGSLTIASNQCAHAEGRETEALGYASHTEGWLTKATGDASHAEGKRTSAIGVHSHAEGTETAAISDRSHAEGLKTTARGISSHAEGENTTSIGVASHAEGSEAIAGGNCSHAEGKTTQAIGSRSHSGGENSIAYGKCAFAHGQNVNTTNANEVAFGAYNKSSTNTLFSVGIGTSTSRKNAFEITKNGTIMILKNGNTVSLQSELGNTTSGDFISKTEVSSAASTAISEINGATSIEEIQVALTNFLHTLVITPAP